MSSRPAVRMRARVRGTVQGVGFRPFVYRLAREQQLAGYVLNDEQGVLLEVEGEAGAVGAFMRRLEAEPPPLAVIEEVVASGLAPTGEAGFRIVESVSGGEADAPVTPDSATCDDCLRELLDPHDRRYRYPFINCTNCGPRFTIVRGVPYDRPQTTMAPFVMCPECSREYHDPGDRRFHAQPNACPVCGPRVSVESAGADSIGESAGAESPDPIRELARRLRAGAIAAIKGIGGYHLACDALNEDAVALLRARKHRDDKPFALMVRDLGEARSLVELDELSETLLRSVARPIVLAPRRAGGAAAPVRVASGVAPGAPELGVMLPYSPLHHLLLADFGGPLVMTSGNLSDDPIAYTDADALERLAPIADVFLLHDREIHARTDDSVVRAGAMLRRSRGYVPGALTLPIAPPRPLLACGAEQKNTFCLAKGARAWVSHHIGDLEHYSAFESFRAGISHFETLFAVSPEVIVHDLHPEYLSTKYALELLDLEPIGVQHHHAHLAAVLAEHGLGLEERAVAATFDGTGYGTDGTVWGGELLVGDLVSFERAGWLRPVRLPGGAAAIREPWRMAFAWLTEAFGEPQPLPARLASPAGGRAVDAGAWRAMAGVLASEAVSPVTTSIGRLFDAVGALCGIAPRATYEGQAAVELEWAATEDASGAVYEIELDGSVIDPRAAIRAIALDLARGVPVAEVALGFHRGVASVTARALISIAASSGLGTVVLSGGVFLNRLLVEDVSRRLTDAGLRVLTPRLLPPGDGAIAFGQAAVAAARLDR